MPKSDDRFYLLRFKHRDVKWGDIGSMLRIQGIVVGGNEAQAVLMLPDQGYKAAMVHTMNEEDWSEYLRRSDDPEILVGPIKAFQRKLRYDISGAVQQKIWVADGFKCLYCRRAMGEVQLTIDHFIPLEMGGANDDSNFVSACRACNKSKGSESPADWCKRRGVNFALIQTYLANRII
jgi:hypothetical protein